MKVTAIQKFNTDNFIKKGLLPLPKCVSVPKEKPFVYPASNYAIAYFSLFRKDDTNIFIKSTEAKLLKLGYKKDKENNFKKNFSEKQVNELKNKYGKYSESFRNIFEKPISKEDIVDFKKFINMDKERGIKAYHNNFEKLFQTFCILKENNNLDVIEKHGKNAFNLVLEYVEKEDYKKNILEDIFLYKEDAHFGKGRAMQYALEQKNADTGFKIDKDVKQSIDNLSKTIDEHVLPKDLILYRIEKPRATLTQVKVNGKNMDLASMMMDASKSGDINKINEVKEFVLDNEIQAKNPRFMSTSLENNMNKTGLKNLVLTKTSFLWKMKVKPNTKGLYIESFNAPGQYAEQNEVILQKGSKLSIENLDYNPKRKTWIIDATVSN